MIMTDNADFYLYIYIRHAILKKEYLKIIIQDNAYVFPYIFFLAFFFLNFF